jgi:hypothetical protein
MDNFNEFIQAYRENIQTISSLVMMENIGSIDPDLLNANICWAVTENMTALLSAEGNKSPDINESNDVNEILNFLNQELHFNKLIIIWQDEINSSGDLIGADHFFAVVRDTNKVSSPNGSGRDNNLVHIIEYLPNICNHVETMTMNSFINYIKDLIEGTVKDRFYESASRHVLSIWSYQRYLMNKKTVEDFIDEYLQD